MKDIDWKILIALYEKKSMTKAAEALYMTQSALTKRVQSIEDEWGVEIVRRSSQGVNFTEEGKYLVNKANVMLDFLKDIEDHFARNQSKKQLLKVGVPNSYARIHMPSLLKEYFEQYNNLEVEIATNNSDVIINQLTSGSIDIGLVCGNYPFLGEKTWLFDEPMYMVTPIGVKIEDVVNYPLIESHFNTLVKLKVSQWWKSHFDVMPQQTHLVPYSDIAIEMVENGLGVTFVFGDKWKVNEKYAQKLPVYDSANEAVTRGVFMMVNEKCFLSEEIMDFVSFVERYYQVNC